MTAINRVFAHMALSFPHRWASAFPTKEARNAGKRVWAKKLNGLTPAELQRGCDNWTGKWPPSVNEFRDTCRPHREPYERAEFQGNALPQLPADRETAQKHLDALRGRMRGES